MNKTFFIFLISIVISLASCGPSKTPCEICSEKGKIECTKCEGEGMVDCTTCDVDGKKTVICVWVEEKINVHNALEMEPKDVIM